MEQNIKPGDIVRLTDPLSNGEVVRIESVEEHGYASWFGGTQKGDMEQIDMADINSDLLCDYQNLSELIGHIEAETGVKLYLESAVNYWKHRAEVAEQRNALNEKLLKVEHNKLLAEQEENAKLRNHIFVLDGKLEKLELDNHSLDQVAKVFQQDLAKKDAEIKEYCENLKLFNTDLCNKNAKISKLQMRNEALKRQLDESNKQIEIHAKRERELERELEEDGGLG